MTIDLSQSAPPDLVTERTIDVIRAEVISDLLGKLPAILAIDEGDPLYDYANALATRELALIQDINAAARAAFLSSSAGTDLENLGANYDIPKLATQSDDQYRNEVHEWPETIGTGSRARYERAALGADPRVRSVNAHRPNPAELALYWLPADGVDPADYTEIGGNINAAFIGLDDAGFQGGMVGDDITVAVASLSQVDVTATLFRDPSVDEQTIRDAIDARRLTAESELYKPGALLPLSLIAWTLDVDGVEGTVFTTPTADTPAVLLTAYEWGTLTLTINLATWQPN